MINLLKRHALTTLILFVTIPFVTLGASSDSVDFDPEGCTTALIAGWATPDGRPLLWKSRDVTNWEQEFLFYDETPYSFISVTYTNEDTQAWGGVNEVGFAIENANAWNFNDSSGAPDDDGIIQYHALQTCATVEDFLAYMDTTARIGRTRPSIYGVFDAFGGAGMLEASLYENFWLDANDSLACPNGVMVRANFAYAGGPNHVGQYRHDRALELVEEAVANGTISARYLFDIVARDLTTENLNPYPLPYQGFYVHNGDTLLYSIRDHNAINREITQSNFVVKGILEGENPLTSTLWVQVGEPTMTPAIPLWVAAGSVPAEVDGEFGSLICLRARELFTYLYYPYPDPYDDIINTYKLIDENGNGILTEVRRIEEEYFDFVEAEVEDWRTVFPTQQDVAALQDSIASVVLNYMMQPNSVDDLVISIESDSLRLNWSPVLTSVFGDTITITQYAVYYSDTYVPGGAIGDLLAYTIDTSYSMPLNPSEECGYYIVKASYEN